MRFPILIVLFLVFCGGAASAEAAVSPRRNAEQLAGIRAKILNIENVLFENQNIQQQAKLNARRLQVLIRLRREERQLGQKRLGELEETVKELESRREVLNAKVREQKTSVRRLLGAIDSASDSPVSPMGLGDLARLGDLEKLEGPRKKLLSNLIKRGLREMEMLKVDLADADQLGNRIQDEKRQLAYLMQDLDEKESVLELNRQLQADLATKSRKDRMAQLESYRKLKDYESQVERLIQDFNAHKELERATETERMVSKMMARGGFEDLKGKLSLPVPEGRVISSFGKAFDPRSKLYVFKKGVDIQAGKKEPVRAISSGKVAYSGTLPNYGQVTIIDHGNHFYSLCAQLGTLSKKAGDLVAVGEPIGLTDDSGTPIYFEIRARNVAVNPLQWISN